MSTIVAHIEHNGQKLIKVLNDQFQNCPCPDCKMLLRLGLEIQHNLKNYDSEQYGLAFLGWEFKDQLQDLYDSVGGGRNYHFNCETCHPNRLAIEEFCFMLEIPLKIQGYRHIRTLNELKKYFYGDPYGLEYCTREPFAVRLAKSEGRY